VLKIYDVCKPEVSHQLRGRGCPQTSLQSARNPDGQRR
jgi:hypothetical protein